MGVGNMGNLLGMALGPATGGASLLAGAIPAGIDLLGGLLGGFLSGNQKKKEEKRKYETWQKQKNERISDTNKYLKPANERYAIETAMPQFAEMLTKLMTGQASDVFGKKAGGWGIDFAKMLQSFTPQAPKPENPLDMLNALQKRQMGRATENERQSLGGYKGNPTPAYVDNILNKYGMNARA